MFTPLYPLIFLGGKNSYEGLFTCAVEIISTHPYLDVPKNLRLFVKLEVIIPPTIIADPSCKRTDVGYHRKEESRIR